MPPEVTDQPTDLHRWARVPARTALPYVWAYYMARRALLNTMPCPPEDAVILIWDKMQAQQPPGDIEQARQLLRHAYRDMRQRLEHLEATTAGDARRMAIAGASDAEIRDAIAERIHDTDVIAAIMPSIRQAVIEGRMAARRYSDTQHADSQGRKHHDSRRPAGAYAILPR